MNTYSLKKNSKGFTLIETLFAILIFSAALVSLMAIAGRGINATASARKQVTAYYLAQEGIEVIRNMRDVNFLSGASSWGNGFDPECTDSADPCNVFYDGTGAPGVIPQCGSCSIEIDPATGFFVEPNGYTDSSFSRFVTVTPKNLVTDPVTGLATPDEYLVVSRVTWESSGGIPRSVELETILKKWQ